MKLINEDMLPTMWCPGCGNGVVLGAVARALEGLGYAAQDTVVVTGIGCFGKADDYMATNALHGTHGRALAFATGVKAPNPKLKVVALMGDGDAATIGGNHFIHAARRNIGVTAVVANNYNYGMTGGQYSATTPVGSTTTTSPYGNPEPGFDLCQLAAAAGASYVARTSVYHVHQLANMLKSALGNPGFSLVEVASSCPIYFGRYNRIGGPTEMMRFFAERVVTQAAYERLDEEQRQLAVIRGEFVNEPRPDFNERYQEIRTRATGGEGR